MSRRFVLSHTILAIGALALAVICAPAAAQIPGVPIKDMLAKASDSALDKLSKPGAFTADDAIRIGLPGPAKSLGSLMKYADKAGLTSDITGSLNSAAEQAAGAAKPIFRAAINKITMNDLRSIGGAETGATDYLRKNAGDEILTKLTPLVQAALAKTGVLKQSSNLAGLGVDEGTLTSYVARKTADGIFTYVGREETRLRQDPVGAAKELLKGMKF